MTNNFHTPVKHKPSISALEAFLPFKMRPLLRRSPSSSIYRIYCRHRNRLQNPTTHHHTAALPHHHS